MRFMRQMRRPVRDAVCSGRYLLRTARLVPPNFRIDQSLFSAVRSIFRFCAMLSGCARAGIRDLRAGHRCSVHSRPILHEWLRRGTALDISRKYGCVRNHIELKSGYWSRRMARQKDIKNAVQPLIMRLDPTMSQTKSRVTPRTGSRTGTSPAASTVRLDRTLTYRLHLLHKLTDQESQRRYPETTGLSMSDGRCLTTIGTFEPLSVNDLAQRSNLTKGQASRAAQYLVDLGMVLKADHPGDGCGVVLTLTASGRKIWKKAMRMVEQRNALILGCLDEAEQAQLSAFLDRLIVHNQGQKVDGESAGSAQANRAEAT